MAYGFVSAFYFVGYFEDAINSLTWSKTNKVGNTNDEQRQGVVSDLLPELTLETDDEQLLRLSDGWMKEWDKFKEKENIDKRQKESEGYWKGDQERKRMRTDEDIAPDNLIFEAVETFLPIAARANPEPIVSSSINSEASMAWNNLLKEVLVWIADEVRLRLKVKDATRHWALAFIGVVKMGWNLEANLPEPYVIRPQKIVLDPNSTVEQGKYTGAFVGEYKEEQAEKLIARFPDKSDFIKGFVEEKLGTVIRYVEWWTPEMVFWTLEKAVLGKSRNPHWDYGEEEVERVDDFGQTVKEVLPAVNHFFAPQMPYTFLSVFNLGKQPIDDTSLIEQNIPQQKLINRLNRQISKNVAQMNGTVIVSSDSFNKDQAKSLSDAVRDGRPVLVPGDVNSAYKRDSAPNIPADVFNHRNDTRNELRSIFGVTGATAQGIANEDTVRGKILVREQDATRVGGGISVYIEQMADDIFNWLVQMIYVYFEEKDIAMILGDEKAVEFMELKAVFGNKRLRVGVKEGSLLPKDSLSQRNEAVELASMGKLSTTELYKRLDFPDPVKAAQELMMENQGQIPGQTPAPVEQPPEQAQLNPLSAVPI